MSLEIERKFLVRNYIEHAAGAVKTTEITQVYLSDNPDATVRLRITDDKAFITVKSRNRGMVRDEWEYEIPLSDARQMVTGLKGLPLISKTRHTHLFAAGEWTVDVFHGPLEGLMLAEIELPDTETDIELPPFVGREVTDDARYYNSVLALATSADGLL